MRNTTQVGTITEGAVLASLLRAGKAVLIPFGDQQDYDLVMEDNGCFSRIQCKTGRWRQGSIYFNLYTMAQVPGLEKHTRRCYNDRVDFYGVYCSDNAKTYLVPNLGLGKAVCVLRVDPTANNQSKNIRWACHYEI
jgi:hypothetical protein